MATRSFLLADDHSEGLRQLTEGAAFPDGVDAARTRFATWLEGALLERLHSFGDFSALSPVLLGSWARHELCPKSDVDLLLLGSEDEVGAFIARAFKGGLKLRVRVPENRDDWTVGVEPFDVLALLTAQALDPALAPRLAENQTRARAFRRSILSAMRKERDERRLRQDGITSYLEPNLKFGGGGLRDIEQALALRTLVPDALADADPYPFKVLQQIKNEFLFLRCYLHLLGSGDILTAPDQLELAGRLGLESPRALMTFVQSELERASFYADWVFARVTAPKPARVRAAKAFTSLTDVLTRLKAEPSHLMQFEVRRTVNHWFKGAAAVEIGRALQKALGTPVKDAFIVSLYRTRLLEGFLPDLKRIRGLVQHDHYHRYTADAHIVQALREVQRVESYPRTLGVLGKLARELSAADWWVLKLTALFHDLAKGRKGDHSSEGARLVETYFDRWGFGEAVKNDVRWLVENHLLLSTAAFRQNPQAQATWSRLFERGVEGRRLTLLAIFTAVDIRATNPEAWTTWKAKLLLELVNNLRSPRAKSLNAQMKTVERLNSGKDSTRVKAWLLALDAIVLETISPKMLVGDLLECAAGLRVPKVVSTRSRRTWVRFHTPEDKPGVFLDYVGRLFGFGLNIQECAVHTLDGIGVYDWFCLRTEKPARQIAKWMSLPAPVARLVPPKVEFQSISVMSADEKEWIFSFRGRDQRGLLLNAAFALNEEQLSIRWARAHTWGQQIDDVFSVYPRGDVNEVLDRLRARFVVGR